MVRAKLGKYEEAVKQFKEILQISPNSAEPYFHMALIYEEKLKNPKSALFNYKQYLLKRPDAVNKKDIEDKNLPKTWS